MTKRLFWSLLILGNFIFSCSDKEEIDPLPDSEVKIDFNPFLELDELLFPDFMIMHDDQFNLLGVQEVQAHQVMTFKDPTELVSFSTLDILGSSENGRRYRLRVFHDIPRDLNARYSETNGMRYPEGYDVQFSTRDAFGASPIEFISGPSVFDLQGAVVPFFVRNMVENSSGVDARLQFTMPSGASSLPLIIRTLDGVWGNIQLEKIMGDTLLTFGNQKLDTITAQHHISSSANFPGEAYFNLRIEGQSNLDERYSGIELVDFEDLPMEMGQVTFPDFHENYSNLELVATHGFSTVEGTREISYIGLQEDIIEITQPSSDIIVNERNLNELSLELSGNPDYFILQFETERGNIQVYSKTLVDGIENLFQIFEDPLLRFMALVPEDEIRQCQLASFSLVSEVTFPVSGDPVVNRLLGIPVESAQANIYEFADEQ